MYRRDSNERNRDGEVRPGATEIVYFRDILQIPPENSEKIATEFSRIYRKYQNPPKNLVESTENYQNQPNNLVESTKPFCRTYKYKQSNIHY